MVVRGDLAHCVAHCVQKKIPTYVFDNNSGISWSIFILFIPMETGICTLQHTYLMAWWRHNCVTLNVTKVYFIELKINIRRLHYVQEKNTHFCFDYNSGVSIFILFYTSGNRDEYSTEELTKFTLTVSPHYLVKLKRHINSKFWSQSSQCVRSNRLLATCTEICPMFFSNSW